ncbi:hypothetical protein JXB11_01900 [Candidatus Woesearchaeota archaeon]|nr:hypothetical protein [Candidatus Woesearchaeota archaeon]
MAYPMEAISAYLILLVLVFAVWEAVWKGIALWKAGRNNQLAWFVVIFIFNTMGILPIVYILWFQKKARVAAVKKMIRKAKR